MPHIEVDVTKRKDIRGRKILAHVARLGDISREGNTPAIALENLTADVLRACTHETPVIEKYGQYVLFIYKTVHGWDSVTIRPDSSDGWKHCTVCGNSKEDMRQSGLLGIAQNIWFVDGCTPLFETVRELLTDQRKHDLVSWTRFQTRYAELRNDGLSDVEAHKQACIDAFRVA